MSTVDQDQLDLLHEAIPVRWICLPAEESDLVQPPELRANYIDGLLDPKRLPKRILRQKEQELGPFGYAGQYGQSPIPLSGGMFEVDKLIFAPIAPQKFEAFIRFWDKAGTAGGDGACSVGVKMGRLPLTEAPPHFWVLDVVRGRWNSAIREKIIRQTAIMDGKSVRIGMEQEPGSGGKESAENTIRNLAGFRCFAERPTGDKFERADPYSAQVNNGNVGLVIAPWNEVYVQEMKYFGPTYTGLKDQIDASSGAFNFLAKRKKAAGGAGF